MEVDPLTHGTSISLDQRKAAANLHHEVLQTKIFGNNYLVSMEIIQQCSLYYKVLKNYTSSS